MFCQKCGKENANDARFCGNCGAGITSASASDFSADTAYTPMPAAMGTVQKSEMTFGKAISTCMGKYATFSGRAARPEYWWFYLFTVLVSWGSMVVDSSGVVSGIANIALLLPSIAAAARRLHDTNRSGWWMLIAFTIIGIIPLIIWLASEGSDGANGHGDPA